MEWQRIIDSSFQSLHHFLGPTILEELAIGVITCYFGRWKIGSGVTLKMMPSLCAYTVHRIAFYKCVMWLHNIALSLYNDAVPWL